jgi:hypothetical protein
MTKTVKLNYEKASQPLRFIVLPEMANLKENSSLEDVWKI